MKQRTKLVAAVLLLATAMIMVLTTSFAWMTLSDSPVVQGIQVTIAGSHTVLVAPDISETVGDKVVHYPGQFSDEMNFSDYAQYDYLKQVGGLLPVSTADGENWYLPTYYGNTDPEVLNGTAHTGQLRPTTDFTRDNSLEFANLTADQLKKTRQGNYVYLDFWVMAPVDGYQLRVSTGAESAGSFVIDLPDPQQSVDSGISSYTLTGSNAQTAAAVRIGFLINEDTVLDDSMLQYSHSPGFNSSCTRLQGLYSDPGLGALEMPTTSFTIFEPNGDLHPQTVLNGLGNEITDGQYAITQPLAKGGIPTDISDRLTVQLTNSWTQSGTGQTLIAQQFATFMAGRSTAGEDTMSLKQAFFQDRLQYQIYPYVTKGSFLSYTRDLYNAAANRAVSADDLQLLPKAGATSDVYMTELYGGVPQRIRMFVWLEGQDVDCINSAAAGSFAISIELAGSNES